MDLKLESLNNPTWIIDWDDAVSGQSHVYGTVTVNGFPCQTVMMRQDKGEAQFEIRQAEHDDRLIRSDENYPMYPLPEALRPYIESHVTVKGVRSKIGLKHQSGSFTSLTEYATYDPDVTDPNWEFTEAEFLACSFDRAEADTFFAAFGFKGWLELTKEDE